MTRTKLAMCAAAFALLVTTTGCTDGVVDALQAAWLDWVESTASNLLNCYLPGGDCPL